VEIQLHNFLLFTIFALLLR